MKKPTKAAKELSILSSDDKPLSSKEYASTLASLKKQIQECQIRAITAANKELVNLYWTIGKIIVEKQ